MNRYCDDVQSHYMCRSCMRRDSTVVDDDSGNAITSNNGNQEPLDLQSIYAYPVDVQGDMNIAEILCSTIPQLEINQMDGLPKMICSRCLIKLLEMQQFQEMCRRSDKEMRNLYELHRMPTVITEKLKCKPSANISEQTPMLSATNEKRKAGTAYSMSGSDEETLVDDMPEVIECVEIANDPLLNGNSTLSATSCDSMTDIEIKFDDYANEIDVIAMEDQPQNKMTSILNIDNETARNPDDYNVGDIVVFDNHDLDICNVHNEDSVSRGDNVFNKNNNSNDSAHDVNENCNEFDNSKLTTNDTPHRRLSMSVFEISGKFNSKNEIPCPVCGKLFRGKYRIRRHMQVHDASERPYACSRCEYRFATLGRLRGHETEVHRALLNQTMKHDVKFSTLDADAITPEQPTEQTQQQQQFEATNSTAYVCNICEFVLDNCDAYNKHKELHALATMSVTPTDDELKPYICKFCNKGFQQSCTLKEHERTHTSERPYLCSECGKSFSSSSNMKQHLMRHMGVLRYECPDCPKRFPCPSDLASHKAVHKNFKPHICEICCAAFRKPSQLKKHKMYHNNDRPHKCDYCEMRFVSADHMRRHMRTHTGEKPYKCRYCERAFAQSNDLIKHLRSHLGENVYKCELCPAGFRLAAELRVHFAEHKTDDEVTRQQHMQALLEEEAKLKLKFQYLNDGNGAKCKFLTMNPAHREKPT